MNIILPLVGILMGGIVWFILRKPNNTLSPESSVQRKDHSFDSLPVKSPSTSSKSVPVKPFQPTVAAVRGIDEPETVEVLPAEMPSELIGFNFERHDTLSLERKTALLSRLRTIPRPPPSLHKLISREFIANATSAELSSVVMGEPLIAAKVIVKVNSPFYGLKQPVVSIGQAITFLGFNSVRSIGIQYMMNESFKTNSAEMNKVFDSILYSSAIASELCYKLGQKLNFQEQGSMVTHVVLSFIGKLATQWLMHPENSNSSLIPSFFERVKTEQSILGLGSAEVGAMLMEEWGLPLTITNDVLDIDRILVTPANFEDPDRGARLGLCFLCSRLGERIALGTLKDLSDFNIDFETDADFFNFKSYLNSPRLDHVFEYLRHQEVADAVSAMQESMKSKSY